MSKNVTFSEIDHFSKYSNDWWNPNGPLRTLHDINPVRVQYIQKHAELTNQRVLDIGCGGGLLSESMAQLGADVTAIDAADDLINIAKQHDSTKKINYLTSTAEEFAETTDLKFNVITCLELLEHVPEPASIIASCKKLLAPHGKLFISTINRTPSAYLQAIIGAEYILKLLPKHTHQYRMFIKPSELALLLRQYDLNLVELTGMKYNPFLRQASLTPNCNINYLAYIQNDNL